MGRYDFIANVGAQIGSTIAQLPEVVRLDEEIQANNVAKQDIQNGMGAIFEAVPDDVFEKLGSSKEEFIRTAPKPRGQNETVDQYTKRVATFSNNFLSKAFEQRLLSADQLRGAANQISQTIPGQAEGAENIAQQGQQRQSMEQIIGAPDASGQRVAIDTTGAPITGAEGETFPVTSQDQIEGLKGLGLGQNVAEATVNLANAGIDANSPVGKDVMKVAREKDKQQSDIDAATNLAKQKSDVEVQQSKQLVGEETTQGFTERMKGLDRESRERIARINASAVSGRQQSSRVNALQRTRKDLIKQLEATEDEANRRKVQNLMDSNAAELEKEGVNVDATDAANQAQQDLVDLVSEIEEDIVRRNPDFDSLDNQNQRTTRAFALQDWARRNLQFEVDSQRIISALATNSAEDILQSIIRRASEQGGTGGNR